jgi:hypothetical protein
MIHSNIGHLAPETSVSSLIDYSTGAWNYSLIQSSFVKFEADLIRSLSLCSLNQPDRLIWSGTTHRCFTVRSAYHLEMTSRSQSRGECSNVGDNMTVWNIIWRLGIPAAVKNFAWKVGNDILPMNELFVRRKIGYDPFCLFCLLCTESICHFFPSSMAVWQECSCRIQKMVM